MDFGTLFIIAITVVIHLIGIGLFVVWLAAGKPTSLHEVKTWWKNLHFLPVRHGRSTKGKSQE